APRSPDLPDPLLNPDKPEPPLEPWIESLPVVLDFDLELAPGGTQCDAADARLCVPFAIAQRLLHDPVHAGFVLVRQIVESLVGGDVDPHPGPPRQLAGLPADGGHEADIVEH